MRKIGETSYRDGSNVILYCQTYSLAKCTATELQSRVGIIARENGLVTSRSSMTIHPHSNSCFSYVSLHSETARLNESTRWTGTSFEHIKQTWQAPLSLTMIHILVHRVLYKLLVISRCYILRKLYSFEEQFDRAPSLTWYRPIHDLIYQIMDSGLISHFFTSHFLKVNDSTMLSNSESILNGRRVTPC